MFGLFGVGNIGNEASLTAGLDALRRLVPDADVVVVGPLPEAIAEQHGVRAVSIITGGGSPALWRMPRILRLPLRPLAEPVRWWTVRRFLRSVDAVVVPGTGILDDFGVGPQQMPYDLYRWTTLARATRTPWAMVAVGAGPIEHRASRWLMRKAVEKSTVVTYRDEGSRRFMAGLGQRAGAEAVQPDVVFSHPVPVDRRPGDVPGHIGLGVMRYGGWNATEEFDPAVFDRYVRAITEIAVRLLGCRYSLRLLVGEDADADAVDRVVEGIRAGLGDDVADHVLIEAIHTFDDLLEQVARTDAVVATRFHNIVAALMMNRPTVSIGYAEKNRDLMTAFGLGDSCHRIEHIDVDRVVADIESVTARRDDLARTLQEKNDANRRAVERRFRDVFAALGLPAVPAG